MSLDPSGRCFPCRRAEVLRRHRGLELHLPHGCLLIQPSEVNTGPGEATGPCATPLEVQGVFEVFVEVERGMLGDFTLWSEISNMAEKKIWVATWATRPRQLDVSRHDKYLLFKRQRSRGMCPNWRPPQNKNDVNHLFFYNPKYLPVHAFSSTTTTWTSGSTLCFRAFKKEKENSKQ